MTYVWSSPAASPGITETSNAKNSPAIRPTRTMETISTAPARRVPDADGAGVEGGAGGLGCAGGTNGDGPADMRCTSSPLRWCVPDTKARS
ncbi:hypothetical protein Slala04_42900 [Streptomyces lavendulae subsp. lavendulae]|nr:hypothetical protein Slala04_42900 [Streptomyces lavendulae subsp. lavendulae]